MQLVKSNVGFWQGRVCIDQVFAVKQVGEEKYLAKGMIYFELL